MSTSGFKTTRLRLAQKPLRPRQQTPAHSPSRSCPYGNGPGGSAWDSVSQSGTPRYSKASTACGQRVTHQLGEEGCSRVQGRSWYQMHKQHAGWSPVRAGDGISQKEMKEKRGPLKGERAGRRHVLKSLSSSQQPSPGRRPSSHFTGPERSKASGKRDRVCVTALDFRPV